MSCRYPVKLKRVNATEQQYARWSAGAATSNESEACSTVLVGRFKLFPNVRERVGLNLQRLRREKGLSQEELAHRAQIHQNYLSGVGGGKRNPTIAVLQRIAEALEADISDLVAKR
jgi:ribosome-binding protein aMBF1 (putative translation factor)